LANVTIISETLKTLSFLLSLQRRKDTEMNFEELILKRQSDRRYLPDPLEKEDIMKCLEAARMSPSACNSQPWKFIVVDDKEKLAEMSEAA
jgi:nitroreductase